jgi:hypothetical protein
MQIKGGRGCCQPSPFGCVFFVCPTGAVAKVFSILKKKKIVNVIIERRQRERERTKR